MCCYKGLDGDAFTATSETLSEVKRQRPQPMPGKKTCTLDCWRHPKPLTGRSLNTGEDDPESQQRTGRQCKSLMFAGKVKAALRMISNEEKGGLLTPDQPVGDGGENVLDFLMRKYPPQQQLVESALTTTSNSTFHPAIFEELNGILSRSVAMRVQGAEGPSGLNAAFWRHMCTAFMVNLINCVRQLPS